MIYNKRQRGVKMTYLHIHSLGLAGKTLYSNLIQRWQGRKDIAEIIKDEKELLKAYPNAERIIDQIKIAEYTDEFRNKIFNKSVEIIQAFYDTIFLAQLLTKRMLEDLEAASKEATYSKKEKKKFEKLADELRKDLHREWKYLNNLLSCAQSGKTKKFSAGSMKYKIALFVMDNPLGMLNLRKYEKQLFKYEEKIKSEKSKPEAKHLIKYFELLLKRRRTVINNILLFWIPITAGVSKLKNKIIIGTEEFKIVSAKGHEDSKRFLILVNETIDAIRSIHMMVKQVMGEEKELEKKLEKKPAFAAA